MVLATLAAQALTQQALATPAVDMANSPQMQPTNNLVIPEETEVAVNSVPSPVASPESLVEPEFSPEPIRVSASSIAQPQPTLQNDVAISTTTSSVPRARSTNLATPDTEVAMEHTEDSLSEISSGSVQESYTTQSTSVHNSSPEDLQEISSPATSAKLLAGRYTATAIPQESVNSQPIQSAAAGTASSPSRSEVEQLQNELRDLENVETQGKFRASPSLSINIPTGYGLDNNTGFVSATYQTRTRYTDIHDGGLGVGIGLGDAKKAVGVELSYTTASFGGSRDFGSGGFNVKVHRQLPNDFAVAAGWNGFLNVGDDNDFENSVYGVATKIIRTRENINSPFSRVAITAGVGNGQFRTEDAVADGRDNINVFGNVAVRVAQPVSLIAEWSGQDLGVGVSVAPFKNIPLVITPAVRDIVGAGDGPRFVLGTGFAFKF
ncbi:MAG TPA: hypothetical protein V6C95_01890 [Coleofasciculaceae cyanobacterium]